MKEGRNTLSGSHKNECIVFDAAFPEGVDQYCIHYSQRSEKELEDIEHVNALVQKDSSSRYFPFITPVLTIPGTAGFTVCPLNIKDVSELTSSDERLGRLDTRVEPVIEPERQNVTRHSGRGVCDFAEVIPIAP